MQGLALLGTAIYETFRHQLTLFHAICVLHLLSLLGLGLVATGKYGKTGMPRWLVLQAIRFLAGAAFTAFTAFV